MNSVYILSGKIGSAICPHIASSVPYIFAQFENIFGDLEICFPLQMNPILSKRVFSTVQTQ